MDNFCDRLNILIKENKTKKKDLAGAIGISPQQITEISKGRSGTTKPVLRAIANFYRVREQWLETGELPIYAENIDGPPHQYSGAAIVEEGGRTEMTRLRQLEKLPQHEQQAIKTALIDTQPNKPQAVALLMREMSNENQRKILEYTLTVLLEQGLAAPGEHS